MKILWRVYAAACGLIVGPALGALLLANIMGMLPLEKIREAYAILELPGSPARSESPSSVEVATPSSGQAKPPSDLRTWEQRLNRMGDGIVTNVEDLGREVAKLEEQEQRFNAVRDALAPLVSVVLAEAVSSDDILARHSEFVDRIKVLRSMENKRPKLLATLQTVDAKSIAIIFSGREGSEGLPELEAVALLSEFPPRKAGEILAAVGKTDPALAARLVSLLGTGDSE